MGMFAGIGGGQRRLPPGMHVESIEDASDALVPVTAPTVSLSDDQATVFRQMKKWLCSDKPLLTLGGFAGCGKTTLVAEFARELAGLRVAFCAYTGKAASVLRTKLAAAGVDTRNNYCGTIHGLIYIPLSDERGEVVGWEKQPFIPADVIVVDEASMVGRRIWDDLRSYGVPILAVGDHGQLPPVGDEQVNVVANPELRLERIHRQAEGNPILRLATHVRLGNPIESFVPDSGDARVQFWPRLDDVEAALPAEAFGTLEMPVICYFNRTRAALNRAIRSRYGWEGPPVPGDVVICLKNESGIIFNGMRGVLEAVTPMDDPYGKLAVTILFPTEKRRVHAQICGAQFGQETTFKSFYDIPGQPPSWVRAGLLFDHGYALTCHKSQGSGFDSVILVVQGRFDTPDDRARWLYTAVTRAAKQLHVIVGR